jgi:RND family efflux transporter MFP subunit
MNIRRFLPLFLILLFAGAGSLVVYYKPDARKRILPPVPVISVQTMAVEPKQYRVLINSFGRIEPRTQGQLVSQVSGQIIAVSSNFRDGGFFQEGEVLVSIDPRDYRIQVDIAAAELANARVTYAEEQVLAEQAVNDRKILRNQGAASDFALHIPQLAAAKSQIAAANAKLEQARLDVERTRIRAPYSGRVLAKSADIGDVISANAALARIYATDLVEVRLPIKNSELPFVDLPEPARSGGDRSRARAGATIVNRLGADPQQWQAVLVQAAGAIDEQSQQLFVTAQIDRPYAIDDSGRRPLKIGQYVTAEIDGRTILDAMVIPNAAIYQGSYVYLFKDGVLERRDIEIAWQNSHEALLRQGISPGEHLVLTPLGRVSSGTPVKRAAPDREALAGHKPAMGGDAASDSGSGRKGRPR